MAHEIEVLFEYKESRRQLCITRSEVCEAIEKELKSLGIQDDLVVSLSLVAMKKRVWKGLLFF